MSAFPYMQLYPSDYLGDTRHLSTEQHGAYFLLLLAMWNADGELEDNDTMLARITGLSRAKWLKHRPYIIKFFRSVGGTLNHKRMSEDLEELRELSEKRAAAGRASGEARSRKNANGKPTENERFPERGFETNPLEYNGAAGTGVPQASKPSPEPYPEEEATKVASSARAPPLGVVELRTEISRAFEAVRSPVLPDTSRAAVWLAQGYQPDIVIAVVREVLARKPDARDLRYFDRPIAEAHTTPTPTPQPASYGGRYGPHRKPSAVDFGRADVERLEREERERPAALRIVSG